MPSVDIDGLKLVLQSEEEVLDRPRFCIDINVTFDELIIGKARSNLNTRAWCRTVIKLSGEGISVTVKLTVTVVQRVKDAVQEKLGIVDLEVESPHGSQSLGFLIAGGRVVSRYFAVNFSGRTELEA